ncbi:MAG: tyrosine-protein phosphatase [Acidobacteria bacterium]|nr:tyrosine-protein phosphatase [Acidobacteriota bacterium]
MQWGRLGVYGVLLAVLAAPVSAARQELEPAARHVRRFAEVTGGIYRGGHPDRAGFEWLRQSGIRTIISLRTGDHGERDLVEQLGMRYIHIPVSLMADPVPIPLNPWKRVPRKAVHAFLRAAIDPGNHPVFVHCRLGKDRTGALVAFYRIAAQGWDARRAYEEARDRGLSWWYRGVRRQLHDFAERRRVGAAILGGGTCRCSPPNPAVRLHVVPE